MLTTRVTRLRPLALRLSKRCLSSAAKTMTPAEMDAAIKEINEEMESLFGSPVSSDSGSVSSSPFDPPLASTIRSTIPQKAAAAQPQPSTLPRDDGHIDTRAVLLDKITTCTSELGATADVERSTSLAKCIAECARAVAALDGLQN